MSISRDERLRVSRTLSRFLRHDPSAANIELDDFGWADMASLLRSLRTNGLEVSNSLISDIICSSEKRRFQISRDGTKIRACYGHSVNIDLGLDSCKPPDELFHGTVPRNLNSIRNLGILPRSRQYVHLHEQRSEARLVAVRYGEPFIIAINSKLMHKNGLEFLNPVHGIWLTRNVPSKYILASMGG